MEREREREGLRERRIEKEGERNQVRNTERERNRGLAGDGWREGGMEEGGRGREM